MLGICCWSNNTWHATLCRDPWRRRTGAPARAATAFRQAYEMKTVAVLNWCPFQIALLLIIAHGNGCQLIHCYVSSIRLNFFLAKVEKCMSTFLRDCFSLSSSTIGFITEFQKFSAFHPDRIIEIFSLKVKKIRIPCTEIGMSLVLYFC